MLFLSATINRSIPVALLALCLLAPLSAQDSRGSIVGRVTDPAGATVPNAEVRATNEATGVSVPSRTNDSGNFTIPFLNPGFYSISAEIAGFNKFVRTNVQVRTTETVELNVQLSMGDVTQTMNVVAETPILSTTEASLGQVMDERRIAELPLFAGNAMDLVHMAPGTVNGTNLRLRKAPFNSAPSQFSSNGGGNNQNEFTIDGVTNIYSDGTSPRVAYSPPQTAISEFKVQTSPFDSGFGATMGSNVNIVTKSGTNDLHGEAHHWLRHSALDVNTIFQNRAGLRRPIYQDNRYGASAGGPIWIPKVYNGKNRSFWFYAWEANKFGDPNVGQATSTVPMDFMRQGDLSPLLALGSTYQIYDPATTTAVAGGRFQRQPIPNNVIPRSRLDPVALKIMEQWPAPNQPSTRDFRNNYFVSGKAIEDYWTMLGRVDHTWNDKNRMFVRLHYDYWQEDKNRILNNAVNGIILNRHNRGIALDDVHVFTPSFLINFRYGITQQDFPERRVSSGFDLASLGFGPSVLSNVKDLSQATFPRTAVAPFTTLSSWESGDGKTSSLIHHVNANANWLKGNHNVRFGPEYRVYREFRARFPLDLSPDLSFNSTYTRGPLDSNAAPQIGGEIASFLLGIPGGSMSRTASYAEQNHFLGLYIQDDWKVTRKLTLNLGIRYEVESGMTERFDRGVYGFAFDTPNPINDAARANYARAPIPELAASQFRAFGGLNFLNDGGNPRAMWETPKSNFLPRIGIALSLNPKTVVRAAYGIFYAQTGVLYSNTIQTGFSQSTPIQATLDNGISFVANTTNPFPRGLDTPLGAAGGLTTNLGQAINFFPTKRKTPYAQRWSFGIQRQLPAQFLLEASYVGNRGTRLNINRQLNATPNEYLSTSPVRDQATINYLGAQFASPFFGLAPIYGRNISRANLLRAYPHFGNVTAVDPVGYSWYHSMQMRVEKRMSRGFTYQLGYTWAKSMEAVEFLNPADPMPYEVISGLDRTHRLTSSGIFEIPVGRKRAIGSTWPVVAQFLIGGWNLQGAMQHQSGAPLGFGNRIFNGDLGNILLPGDQRSVDQWFNVNAGFERSPALQLASNLRTFPLRFSGIRGDGQNRWDFGLIKNFQVGERVRMQFRAEAFNAWNQTNVANPNADPTSGAFGTVTSQDPPRSFQFSLKLNY